MIPKLSIWTVKKFINFLEKNTLISLEITNTIFYECMTSFMSFMTTKMLIDGLKNLWHIDGLKIKPKNLYCLIPIISRHMSYINLNHQSFPPMAIIIIIISAMS